MSLAGLAIDLTEIEDSDAGEEYEQEQPTLEEALRYNMPFGKHKGKSLKDLLKKRAHRSYLRYIQQWDELENPCKINIDTVIEAYENTISSKKTVKARSRKKKKTH